MNASKTFWFVFVLVSSHVGVSQATLMYYRYSDDNGYVIKQLNLTNGQTITVDPGSGEVYEMAVDPINGVLYKALNYDIVKVDLADGSSEAIIQWEFPTDIAIDPLHGHLYWTYNPWGDSGRGIARANLDGGSIETVIDLSSGREVGQLSLDLIHGQIYWSETGSINRANLDGSNHQVLTTAVGGMDPGVAVDPLGSKVYWTINMYPFDSEVWWANLDGSEPECLVNGLDFGDGPQQVELDFSAGKMYINSMFGDPIVQANFDGTELEPFPWYDSHWVGHVALDSMIIPEPASIWSLLLGLALLLSAPLLLRRRPR